jgi:ABC-type branched-subunit amino acid transport system substrate-binding protein
MAKPRKSANVQLHSHSNWLAGRGLDRRTSLKILGGTAAAAATSVGFPSILRAADKIKIGFVTALTGLETILGETQLNCFKLAVEEINAEGGAGGREIEFVVEDDQTTTKGAIDKTRKVIYQDEVDVIIGMIASLERVAALSVSVPAKKLVIYPTYYEGGECNRYLVCTGQVPNQAIDPFVPWVVERFGKSVYVLGSDYVWPHKTAEAVKAAFAANGGEMLGSDFFPFGTQDLGPALDKVKAAKPDMVWELFAGADAVTFLKQYQSYGMEAQLVTNGLDELFTTAVPGSAVEGIFVNQSYFHTLDTPANKKFVAKYQKRFGEGKLVNAIAEATYAATWLYAKAVAKADSVDTEKVIDAVSQVDFAAPQGHVNISAKNQHMVCNSIIGRCRADGLYDIVENFGQVPPEIPGCDLT